MGAAVKGKPPSFVEWRMCKRKIRHASRTAASRQARRCERARGGELFVYRCPLCSGWHTTRQAQGSDR